jgi:hypothetical protein
MRRVRQTPPLPLRLNPVLGPHGSTPEALTHRRPLCSPESWRSLGPASSAEPHPSKGIPLASRIAVAGLSLVSVRPETESVSMGTPDPLPIRAPAEQSDEPVEAQALKMSYHDLGVINVRFAGYRSCSADPSGATSEPA